MKQIFRKSLLFRYFLFIVFSTSAQQKPQYTQYLLNQQLLNPAVTGIENYIEAKAAYRSQWTGLDGAPVTSYLSLSAPIGREFINTPGPTGSNPYSRYYPETYQASPAHHGIGLQLLSDQAGPYTTTDIAASYAYHLGLSQTWNLALGLQAGFQNFNLDPAKLSLTDPGDPAFLNAAGNHWRPAIGAGLWAYSPTTFIGLSAQQLLPAQAGNGTAATPAGTVNWFLTAGLKCLITDDLALIPSAMLKVIRPLPPSVDLSLKAAFGNRFWIGASYRDRDGLAGLAGLNISPLLNIAYAYDYNTSALRNVNTGSHEIVLTLLLNNRNRVLCPEHTF
ncbi:PorP/SprF family type IX secretion system membrane protein [Mucilaginibacter ginsenosidivorans]|uniref:Type IX secretion system membrane protein PorP/SprF n=1 Tax=Mucilaginibacter ginsenosidivorans TaxID=398053 RepID=A0A5B8UTU9_9SPHI|nr:type IX secretion system membrane protein PorP/SprF [Mucilaginibacter ginsenosidivorans]QEC62537.1 type IX secretion system membrane protein PorP/SprF [Mucilaginibacter ginsenosidivorans]